MNDADKAVVDPGERCELCARVLHEVEGRIEKVLGAVDDRAPVLLDVGCWDGEFTMRCASRLEASRVLGVEVYEEPAQAAVARGIEVARVDLETQRFPWPDESVDVIVCNQVLEHLKNIWLPMTEMHRVLRPGGHAVLSVPNLASLHNRVLLGLGRQPTSIRVFGPHVRGYTWSEFRLFVEKNGAYSTRIGAAAGFYPVPSPWSAPLSAIWKGAGHTIVLLARKESGEPVWNDDLDAAAQTFYGDAASDS
jgi:methionine biosynthesis protein MetW